MAREILWYKDLKPAEEEARRVKDRTNHGNDGVPAAGVSYEDVPGRGKVLTCDAAGDVIAVTPGGNLWSWPWGFNWTYANRDGVRLTVPKAGVWDGAIFTAYNDGGTYKVRIPANQGGGGVILVRGVYLATEEFTWDNITADPFNPDIVNYYSAHVNQENETIITLTGNPGGQVQVYYIHEADVSLVKYDGTNDWPTVVYWQHGDGTWDQHWAVDKLPQLIHGCWLYEKYSGRSTALERAWLWNQYKVNVPVRTPPLMMDGFDLTSWAKGTKQYYRNSTVGNSPIVFRHFGIVFDQTGRQCLRFHAYLPNEGDGAWFGTYLGIDDLSQAPWNNLTGMKLAVRGLDQGSVLHIQMNAAKLSDQDKYSNPNHIYSHAIPDYFSTWTNLDIPISQFWRSTNVYYDGTRVLGNWYVYCSAGGTPNLVFKRKGPITVAGDTFYVYHEAKIDQPNYTYYGVGVSNKSGVLGRPTGQTNINFLVNVDTELCNRTVEVRVTHAGGNPAVDYCSATITLPSEPGWTRQSVAFNAFTPAVDPDQAIDHVQWHFNYGGFTGSIRLADICFGDKIRFADHAQALFLVQFYLPQNGNSSQEFYLDDWRWGPDVADLYPYAPPLSINIKETGLGSWQGPTLVHYVQPMVPYVQGDSSVLATWLSFVKDSQDAFHNTYKGTKGPVIPLHSRNFLEVCHYIGAEAFNRFCWASRYRHYGKVVGLWLFNGALADSSERGHNFTWLGGGSPTYTTGICQPGNTAIVLDGAHSLQVDNHSDFNMAGDWSLACVFKTSTANRYLLNKIGGGAGYSIKLTSSGYIQVWVSDGTNSATFTGSTNLADGEYHLVVVRYQAGGNMYVVVDGAAVGSVSVAAFGDLSNGGHFIVGADSGYSNTWVGQLDYLKVWNGYCVPQVEAVDLWSYVNCQGFPTVYPETSYAYSTFAWSFAWVAEYYYFTGDSTVATWLSNIVGWLDAHFREDPAYPNSPKGYQIPQWFWESGYGYWGYDAEVLMACVRGMLFYYWRTGDSRCNTWIRRLLDDFRVNRYDHSWGGYIHDGKHRAYSNGHIFRTWGLVVNGRPPGAVNPPGSWYNFAITTDDTEFYETYAAWWFDNVGDTQPNVLNSDLMPYVICEDADDWAFWPNYVFRSGMGSSESMINVALAALEWGRYNGGDYSWFLAFKDFWVAPELNVNNFTCEAWIKVNSPHTADIILKPNSYRLSLNNGYPAAAVYYGGSWHTVTGTRAVDNGSWGHVAASFDGATINVYYNGIKVGSGTVGGLPDITEDDAIIAHNLYGSVAEVLIRNQSSSQTTIRHDMLRWVMAESLRAVELIECKLEGLAPLCFCTGDAPLQVTSYDRNGYPVKYTYTPAGFDRDGIRREMVGAQYTASVRVAVTNEVLAMIDTYNLIGALLTIKMTLADSDHSNPDNTATIFCGRIKSWEIQNMVLTVTAADLSIDLGGQCPPAFYDYFCRHWFKGGRCMYVGSEETCHKTETFCRLLGNVLHFGGFKFVPRLMRRRGG